MHWLNVLKEPLSAIKDPNVKKEMESFKDWLLSFSHLPFKGIGIDHYEKIKIGPTYFDVIRFVYVLEDRVNKWTVNHTKLGEKWKTVQNRLGDHKLPLIADQTQLHKVSRHLDEVLTAKPRALQTSIKTLNRSLIMVESRNKAMRLLYFIELYVKRVHDVVRKMETRQHRAQLINQEIGRIRQARHGLRDYSLKELGNVLSLLKRAHSHTLESTDMEVMRTMTTCLNDLGKIRTQVECRADLEGKTSEELIDFKVQLERKLKDSQISRYVQRMVADISEIEEARRRRDKRIAENAINGGFAAPAA